MRLRILSAFLLGQLALCLPANATGEIEGIITLHDWARLANHSAARDEAVAQARQSGSRNDLTAMDKLLFSQRLSFQGVDLTGNWQCRTIKVGGISDIVIYSWFRCRVTDDGSGWRLQKLSGSQRTTGRFFTFSDTQLTYLGSGTVNDDKPLPYGSGVDSDEAGYAFRTGRNSWHIEFPSPRYESRLDILEFRR